MRAFLPRCSIGATSLSSETVSVINLQCFVLFSVLTFLVPLLQVVSTVDQTRTIDPSVKRQENDKEDTTRMT